MTAPPPICSACGMSLPEDVAFCPHCGAATPAQQHLRAALTTRYTIERELGRGGMATVYLAQDLRHQRRVALKVLRPELAAVLGAERFLREIHIAAQLNHPHVLPLFDSGESAGQLWYVMPLVEGESLRERLNREGQLPLEDALTITREVADALGFAHSRGIVHRDIKPENILLSGGHALVADFGIARAMGSVAGDRLTGTGISIGTPGYMSPEQAVGDTSVDLRSDIYSLGCVLYEMLAGEPPYTGPTTQAILAKQLGDPVPSARRLRDTVPAAVDDALGRMLAKAPADRFSNLNAFTSAIQGPASPRTAARRWRLQHTLIAVGLLVIAGLVAWRLGSRGAVARARARDPAIAALYQRGLEGYERRTPQGILDAIAAFTGAIQRDSADAGVWWALAKSYVRADERAFVIPGLPGDSVLHRAVAAVDRALVLDPGRADAWLAQGILTRRVDPTDLGPGLRAIRRSILLDSTRAEAWHFLAMFRAESGDMAGAMEAWRRCVQLDPAYTLGLAFLGIGHYWRREYDSAAVWADSAIALDPNYLLGRTSAGYTAVERRGSARAVAQFEAARRLSTGVEVVNALAGRALAEARAGRRAEAQATLRRADSLAGAYVPASLHMAVYLAHAHAALGEAAAAVAWLKRYSPREDLHFQLHLRCDPPFDPSRRTRDSNHSSCSLLRHRDEGVRGGSQLAPPVRPQCSPSTIAP